jgi:predicted amidohydrolase YtcJ
MSVNSRALELAGITRDTPNPSGGTIDRDPDTGEPTGVLRETAMQMIRRVVPLPSQVVLRRAILEASARNLRHGITTVWEPSIEPDHLEAYRALEADGELPIRVVMAHKKVLRSGEEVPLPQRFTGDWLSLVAVKLFQDGGFGGATAALSEPYANAPETRGLLVWAQNELNQRARDIHAAGLRISIHAIGDAAITSALDAIEYATEGPPPGDYRHRIEHCGLPLPGILERVRRLGVVPALQPVFLWFDGDVYMDRVGAERSRWLYPVKTLLDMGLPVSGSSDAPVVPDINPLLGMYTAVTRRSRAGRIVAAEEAISVEQGLSLYTSQAAYACGEERLKGTLSVGKMADFVVLGADPLTVPVDDLPSIPVEMVIVDGRVQVA